MFSLKNQKHFDILVSITCVISSVPQIVNQFGFETIRLCLLKINKMTSESGMILLKYYYF